MSSTTITVGAAALALALSGCAAAPPATPPSPTVTSTPGEITVAGVAHRGALPSCVTFTALDGRHFVLLDGTVPADVPVFVRGTPDPDAASYCNAGTPLHVSSAAPR